MISCFLVIAILMKCEAISHCSCDLYFCDYQKHWAPLRMPVGPACVTRMCVFVYVAYVTGFISKTSSPVTWNSCLCFLLVLWFQAIWLNLSSVLSWSSYMVHVPGCYVQGCAVCGRCLIHKADKLCIIACCISLKSRGCTEMYVEKTRTSAEHAFLHLQGYERSSYLGISRWQLEAKTCFFLEYISQWASTGQGCSQDLTLAW